MSEATIAVDCRPDSDGWRCTVTVGEDPDVTRHEVSVRADDVRELGSGAMVDELVRASFAFLLERERRESILRAFDVSVISRYFPEYEREIRARLQAESGQRNDAGA
ncbi:MAG: hypothetical protein ACRDFZ_06225 [Candidatus Limnocylindria bacterium]